MGGLSGVGDMSQIEEALKTGAGSSSGMDQTDQKRQHKKKKRH
jgi:hypothetical protein